MGMFESFANKYLIPTLTTRTSIAKQSTTEVEVLSTTEALDRGRLDRSWYITLRKFMTHRTTDSNHVLSVWN